MKTVLVSEICNGWQLKKYKSTEEYKKDIFKIGFISIYRILSTKKDAHFIRKKIQKLCA